jgi:Integrase core domain
MGWIAGQVTEAFHWEEAPGHLVRGRHGALGPAYPRRIDAMAIRRHPTAPHSPWQNGRVERLIGSIRRECHDPVIVFGGFEFSVRSPLRLWRIWLVRW